MFRKLSLAAAAAASLAAAALAPTAASAWVAAGPGWHHGWGPRFYAGAPYYFGPPVSYGYGTCFVRRLVPTPWGPRWRLVNTCY
jgi:hypothetical protein